MLIPVARIGSYLKVIFGGLIFATFAIMGLGVYALATSPHTGLKLVFGNNAGLGYLKLHDSPVQEHILPVDRLIKVEGIVVEKQDLLRFPEFFYSQAEARWWQKQQKLYEAIRRKNSLKLEFSQENRPSLIASVAVRFPPLLEIVKRVGLINLIALIFIAMAIHLFYKRPTLPNQLCAFFTAFVALYFASAAPVAYRDITLPPDLFQLLIKGVFIGAGGMITLVHFALIFPKPKPFLITHPRLIYVLYAYSLIGVLFYHLKITAFGTTFPFLFLWVLVMVGAFLHSWFTEKAPLLKQQIRLALVAPVAIGLVFVLLLLLPAFLDLPPLDFSYFALFALVLPFALSFAIDNFYLYQEKLELEKTSQREKEQIRQDLHDSILNGLANISLFSEVSQTLMGKDNAGLKEKLSSIKELARDTSRQLRGFLWVTGESLNTWEDLAGYLRRYGYDLLKHLDIDFDLKLSNTMKDTKPPPLPVRVCLYQVFREAMTNIIKHSRADKVSASTSFASDTVTFEIKDNGAGFDQKKIKQGHYGLKNMQNRVNKLSGTFVIETNPDQGTRIKIYLPLT